MSDLEKRLHSYEPFWGEWRLERRIYTGSGSAVFEISRQRLDQQLRAALKVIRIRGNRDEMAQQLEQALDEIQRMLLLQASPHILSYLDDAIIPQRDEAGEIIGYDVLIRMEYAHCLADDIREGRSFSEEEVKDIGWQISLALAAAHRKGIVHRDIKPANLYYNDEGCYLLGDFGASSKAEAADILQTIVGTTAYMAPEVMLGAYDKRADLYSLGLVLYQLLNDNYLPFTDGNSSYGEREEAIRKRRRGMRIPWPKRGSKGLVKVILRALSPQPEKRYSSAKEMGLALTGKRIPSKKQLRIRRYLALACLGLFFGCGGFFLGRWLEGGTEAKPLPQVPTDFFDQATDAEESVVISTYEVITQNLNWEKAKVYCESRGGHLATITSRKEETEIIALLEEAGLEAAWIGANNLNAANGFQWLTGERFSYAAWGTNEPNNTGDEEYYLMLMYNAEQGWVWNDSHEKGMDVFAPGKVGFVCEWDENDGR